LAGSLARGPILCKGLGHPAAAVGAVCEPALEA